MIGVVVAAHGRLAEELIRTAEAVVGKLDRVVAVNVSATIPDCRERIAQAIREVEAGDGVVVLADLLGGSPCNLGLSFVAEKTVEVVTGVNLPMLLKVATLRPEGKTVAALARDLADAGRKSIGHASEILRRMA